MKDNIPWDRLPLATATLIAIDVLAYLLSPHHSGLPSTLLDLLLLVLLGGSVECALGRIRFCTFCLLAGLLALAVRGLAGGGSSAPLLFATAGASAAVLGGYLPLHPRARVLTLIFVPFLVTIIELPAALFLGLWLAAQISLGVFGLEHYLGPGAAAYLAHVGSFAFGLILIRLFAKDHRRRSSAPPAAGGVLIG